MNNLFVYGSLGPGKENEHVLAKLGGSWQRGYVFGKRFEEGWGAGMGYPGVRLDERGERIDGFIFHSEKLESYWKELDEFEGMEYSRVKTKVYTDDASIVIEAYIYVIR